MAVFGPLQNGRPVADHQKFVKGDYVGDPYSYVKFVAHPPAGGFRANEWNITNFYLYFFGELTYRSDRSKDFLAWWLKRRGIAEGCAFLGMLILLSFRASNSPKTLQCGREFTFSSLTRKILKLAYYHNYFLDSNQILHSDKDYQMPFVGGPNTRTTNPRWRTTAIEKSLYLSSRLTDCHEI